MRYSAERKNAALAMMQNHSINHTSNELGIHSTTLLRWRKENAVLFTERTDESALEGACADSLKSTHEEETPVLCQDSAKSDCVATAQVLVQKPKHVLVGEIAVLLAENEKLAGDNARLRQAMKELLA